MSNEIAVLENKNGMTVSFNEPGTMRVYHKTKNNSWSAVREKDFDFETYSDLKELRKKMDEVIEFLNGASVFVASSVSGIGFYSLQKANISVWECEGAPLEYLEEIALSEQERELKENTKEEEYLGPEPVEGAEGCYQLNLKVIQVNNANVTSRQVLLPFLRKGDFRQLEVICSHIPRWIEEEMPGSGFVSEITASGENEVKLVIKKQASQLVRR